MTARVRFILMAQVKVFTFSSLLIFLLLVFRSDTSGAAVLTGTPVCGQIAANTTWTAANSPYTICGTYQATVLKDVTLTIEPGVRVEFDSNGRLNVEGVLNALGTSTLPITFTSSSSPNPGSWAGVVVDRYDSQPAIANLDWATLEYGGTNIGDNAQVYIGNGAVTMTHSTVRFSGGYGVFVHGTLNPQITDTRFQGNAKEAVHLMSARDDFRFHNLIAAGNGQDVISIDGYATIPGNRRWQNPGIPYLITRSAGNSPGDSLVVEPGTLIQFASNTSLDIGGTLTAAGLPGQPITFTALTPTPGFWNGIQVEGSGAASAAARFEFVTLEYGGSGWAGSNLRIMAGQVQMRHSIVRYGGNDGIRNAGYGQSRSLIETSQIIDNAAFGLNNQEPTWPVLANNNWWGDPNGPQLPVGSSCGPGGNGNQISDGVIIHPVLAGPDAPPDSPPAESMRLISIKPLRWFVPATGVDRLYVEITLMDAKGAPIPGREVGLNSTLGKVVDGGVTGFDGKTLAYVTSSTAGTAELNATLNTSGACALARSPVAEVTFTPATAEEGYLLPSQAPYLDTGIQIAPLPVVQGVPTKLSISVYNPNDFPIVVDGAFSFIQSSIGLAFGPLAEVPGTQIPAKGQALIQATWVPPLSGHYCIQFDYTARSSGTGSRAPMEGDSRRRNLATYPGSKHSPEVQNAYDTSRKAVSALGDASDGLTLATDPAGFIGGYIPGWMFSHITSSWYDAMDWIDKALTGDPPRQDFKIISLPQAVNFTPLQSGPGVSPAKAEAANAYMRAALDLYANLRAASLANDRYGGANQAKDIQWASLQLGALLYYEQQAALQMPALADRIDQYVAVVLQENPGDIVMTAAIYQAYQDRLRTQGFNSDEIAAAHLLGMTDAEIEAMRQRRLALDPASTAGSVTGRMTTYAQTLRDLAYALLNPAGSVFSMGGSAGNAPQALTPNDQLARLFSTEATLQVGNPYNETKTVDVAIRRIDLPPDWLVTVSPSSASLAAGEIMTVTVHIDPGAPAPQGMVPSFAVEGYVGSDLIGGAVMDAVIPDYTNFDGKLRIYLPMVKNR